jgi:hypothetical protein
MRTRLLGIGARAVLRALLFTSALCASSVGAHADEYVPSQNLLCGRRSSASAAPALSGVVLIGIGIHLLRKRPSKRPSVFHHPIRAPRER